MYTPDDAIYEFGLWRLDASERRLVRQGAPVPLTPKVFETLLLLVQRAGTLVTKDEFMKRVWPDTFVEDLALVQNISQIRKILADASEPVIETVPKRGYRFVLPVRIISPQTVGRRAEDRPIQKRRAHSVVMPISGVAMRRAVVQEESAVPAADLPLAMPDRDRGSNHPGPQLEVLEQPGRTRRVILSAAGRAVILLITAIFCVTVGWFAWKHHQTSGGAASAHLQPVMIPLLDLTGDERMPALSPDGSRIAFVRQTPELGKTGIYVEVVGTQSLLQLTTDENDSEPAWSPDGRNIAFLRTSRDRFSIEIVPALGGQVRRLYTGTVTPVASPIALSFSPSGDQLAFSDWNDATQKASIKLLSFNDLKIETLTNPPGGYHDCAPQFSPDGSRIAFVRSTGPMFVDDLYIVSRNGGNPERVTNDKRRIFSAPAWFDDGKQLLFSSTRAGMKSLWRVSASGGEPVAVVGSGPGSDHPTYSSATHELASEYSVEDENLWRVSLNKPGEKQATSALPLLSPKTSNLMPQFSPDGTKLVFESDRSGYEEIWICNSDGSNPVQVTKLERYAGSPNWSPDGKSIVFDFRSSLHSGIYTLTLDGGTPQPVAVFPNADNVVPSWSRDGQWIYFASNFGGAGFHVWKVKAAGAEKPKQITRGEGFKALESEDGNFVYFTRLTDPRIRKVPGDSGPETLVEGEPTPDLWANWTIARNGIFFLASDPMQHSQLRFMEAATRRTFTLFTLTKPSFYGLTVSADGQAAVFSERDRAEHDVVLVKGFE